MHHRLKLQLRRLSASFGQIKGARMRERFRIESNHQSGNIMAPDSNTFRSIIRLVQQCTEKNMSFLLKCILEISFGYFSYKK